LFDVLQAGTTLGLAVNHPPTGGNIGESRPQAVLLFVVYQHEEGAVVVIERIGTHSPPDRLADMCQALQTLLNSDRLGERFGKVFSLSFNAAQTNHLRNDQQFWHLADMASEPLTCNDGA
jgi:hypothetical protein